MKITILLILGAAIFSHFTQAEKSRANSFSSNNDQPDMLIESDQNIDFLSRLYRNNKQSNKQNTNQLLPSVPFAKHSVTSFSSTANQENTCPEFHNLDGEDLVQALLDTDWNCITRHISYPPSNHLEFLFSESKMITMIRKFKELSEIYQGDNEGKIIRFLEYVFRGYYYRIYYLETLDRFFTERLKEELHQSLRTFVDNPYFTSTSADHLEVLYRFIDFLYLSNEAAPYINHLIDLLDNFSLDHPEFMRTIITTVFYIYQGSHVQNNIFDDSNNFEFRDHILNTDTKALEALIQFSKRDDLLNSEEIISDNASVLYKAVENIGFFLQYGDYPKVYHLALDRMEEILSQYSINSDEKFLRFLASNAIKHWGENSLSELKPNCSTNDYDICSDDLEWREALFPSEYTHKCYATDEIHFKFMREASSELKKRACASLIQMDHLFHELLKTRRTPVAGDHNDLLEIIVFASRSHMVTYGSVYDVAPSIGGAYREGDPLDPENIPRVFVHEVQSGDFSYVNVLEHEFVHYLDGRYNKYGHSGYPASTDRAVWWIEGLATYIPSAKYQGNPSSITRERYRLSEIFPDENISFQRTYFYGSLSVRFLLEEHFDLVRELINIMRDGPQGWRRLPQKLQEIGQDLNDEFDTWLDNLIDFWNDPSQGYCKEPPRYNVNQNYIASLSLAGHHIPNYLNTGYALLNHHHPISLSSNSSYRLDIQIRTDSLVPSDSRIEVWVDWNEDKEFLDDEKVIHTTVTLSDLDDFQTISQALEIPNNREGVKRMRVRVSDSAESIPHACSGYKAGETEDYALNILSSSSSIQVHSIPEERNSLLRVRNASQRSLVLSDIFRTDSGQELTYEVFSFDPQKVRVTLDNDYPVLVIQNISSLNQTGPVKIVLTAENEWGEKAQKEFFVLFEPYTLSLFLSTEDLRRESFVRVINLSDRDGVIQITARDDSGNIKGPVSLSLKAHEVSYFNSSDLEDGNAHKGIEPLGSFEGDLRLNLESDLNFKALSYVRTKDGFLTSMNESVNFEEYSRGYRYHVPIFNPASNLNQQSFLKLFNPSDKAAYIEIKARDDKGSLKTASFNLLSKNSQVITSDDLENGSSFLTGSLGDGAGKWRFKINSSEFIEVINLMKNPTGHLSNLSAHPSSSTWQNKEGGRIKSQLVLLLPPTTRQRHGFIRIVNHSSHAGEIRVKVKDDSFRDYGAVQLSIEANSVKYFNSNDLANGNAGKGIPQGFGNPQGMWRLHFESELDIEVLNYMRSSDGFLTKLYGILPMTSANQYEAYFFNPASNQNQRSLLRFINNQDQDIRVFIRGTDDSGKLGNERVRFLLPAGRVKILNSLELENGGQGLRGSFGDGAGKWKLSIETTHPLPIMNLMESPNGYLSNLSTL